MLHEQSDEPKRRIGRFLNINFLAAAGLSVAFVGPSDVTQFRHLTVVEWLTILAVVIVLGGLLLPDSATMTRWSLEKRARNFKPTFIDKLTNESIIAPDTNVVGTWTCRHSLNRSTFTFSQRNDGQLDVDFATSGCLGGCNLSRTALMDSGVTQLNSAVAEYLTRTYDRLYVIRHDGTEYLLPADTSLDFERELDSDSDGWGWYLFRRDNEVNER